MPMPGFMTLKGDRQGSIEGSSQTAECSDCIEIHSIDHQIEVQRQLGHSTLASGVAVHGPITIVKPIDAATPKLYQAMCDLEDMEGEISWYRPSSRDTSKAECFYSIELEGLRVVRIEPLEHHVFDPTKADYPLSERVSMTYRLIRWTWEPRGIEYEQSWAPDGGMGA